MQGLQSFPESSPYPLLATVMETVSTFCADQYRIWMRPPLPSSPRLPRQEFAPTHLPLIEGNTMHAAHGNHTCGKSLTH